MLTLLKNPFPIAFIKTISDYVCSVVATPPVSISKILKKSQSTISQILRNARKQLTPLKQSASEPSQELEAAKSQS